MSGNILSQLNPQQKIAVKHREGPLLILAGAGSGKTRVLTYRIAYLIKNYQVAPENILAVTFTNKAADEMKSRVKSLVNRRKDNLWVSTFHSFCARVLRKEIIKLGYDRNFVIYDTSEQKSLIKNIIKEDLDMDTKDAKPGAILGTISQVKNELISPEEFEKKVNDFFKKLVSSIYPLYQQKLKANNALDFGDLIIKTVELFEENPLVLEYYQDRFKYLLIDEYQDVNFAQYRLSQLLAAKNRNICVVGDPDQSIYGFRGADIRNILNFEEDYQDAKVVKLEQNYRSKETILEAAHNVIENNQSRKEKRLWTDRGEGEEIELYSAGSGKDEANYICKEIKDLNNDKYDYSDIGIMYRTNSQSRVLEEALMKYNIPYQLIAGTRFYDRMEIMDIIAYLRVIYNRDDDLSLMRIINKPKRGIGAGTLKKLQNYADKNNLSLYQAGIEAGHNSELTGVYEKRVINFFSLIKELKEEQNRVSLNRLMDMLLSKTGYRQNLREKNSKQAEARLENINELYSVIEDYTRHSEEPTLSGFLEKVALLADVDDLQKEKETVTLLTLHSAKGLEFPVVFITGM